LNFSGVTSIHLEGSILLCWSLKNTDGPIFQWLKLFMTWSSHGILQSASPRSIYLVAQCEIRSCSFSLLPLWKTENMCDSNQSTPPPQIGVHFAFDTAKEIIQSATASQLQSYSESGLGYNNRIYYCQMKEGNQYVLKVE
jgi:hypothetical protein